MKGFTHSFTRDTKESMKTKKILSTHQKIFRELPKVIKPGEEMLLTELADRLKARSALSGLKIRVDYLVCNLMGHDYLVDCSVRTVSRMGGTAGESMVKGMKQAVKWAKGKG